MSEKPFPYIYRQPSLSEGSALVESTNLRLKVFGKKFSESSKEQNLNLPHTGNYLHIIYIVFTTFLHNIDIVLGIISNLEVI